MNRKEDVKSQFEDVILVADELKRLREKIKQYGDASKALNEIGDALKRLNSNIGKIESTYSSALKQLEQIKQHAESGKKTVEQLVSEVPEIIQRVEAFDVTRSLQEFTKLMLSLEQTIDSHNERLDKAVSQFQNESATQLSRHLDIDGKLEGIFSEVCGLKESSAQNLQKQDSLNSYIQDTLSATQLSRYLEIQQGLSGLFSGVHALKELSEESRQGLHSLDDRITSKIGVHAGAVLGEISSLKEGLKSFLKEELSTINHVLIEQNKLIRHQGELLDQMSQKKKGWFS